MPSPLRADVPTCIRLIRLSLAGIIAESSFTVALLIELALVANALPPAELAAYAAVSATLSFTSGIFSFATQVTMSQVARAVGAKDWHEVGRRWRIALLAAIGVGALAAVALLAFEAPLYRVLNLTPPVEAAARAIWKIKALLLPAIMLDRVCIGLLVGLQRMRVNAMRAFLVAALEVVGQVIALRVLRAGLVGSTLGSVIASAVGACISLTLALCFAPLETRREFCCGGDEGQVPAAIREKVEDEEGDNKKKDDETVLPVVAHEQLHEIEQDLELDDGANQPIRARTAAISGKETRQTSRRFRSSRSSSVRWGEAVCEYWKASQAMVIRSLLLSGSLWSMSIAASNIGPSALAAHQVRFSEHTEARALSRSLSLSLALSRSLSLSLALSLFLPLLYILYHFVTLS